MTAWLSQSLPRSPQCLETLPTAMFTYFIQFASKP